jgi:predicted nucleotide-binding protein (sugar kinase/HSP70/actin superfamily)
MQKLRVGIPEGLYFYYYKEYWQTLFQELSCEVVYSGKTTKNVINAGIDKSVGEICIPMKIYAGLVLELLGKGVDYIYIPRLVQIHPNETFCPKFRGLPEMLTSLIPELRPKLITHDVDTADEFTIPHKQLFPIRVQLGKTKKEIKQAHQKALHAHRTMRLSCLTGKTIAEANGLVTNQNHLEHYPLKLALLGYPYTIFDRYVSMNIVQLIRLNGADVATWEMISDDVIRKELNKLDRPLFWTFTNRLMGAALHFFGDPQIDGVIHLTAFSCGLDAMFGQYLSYEADRYGKPLITIRVDEHMGEAHLQTRVEAFTDMLKRTTEKAGMDAVI